MIEETLRSALDANWPMFFIFTTVIVTIRLVYLIVHKDKFVLYKELFMLILLIYAMWLFYVVTFQDVNYGTNNFVPFKEIFRYEIGSKAFIKNILGNRFGKVTDDMIIYMHEEWFEKQARKLNIIECRQTKNFVEIVLPKDVSLKIDGENLFFTAYEICKYFRFSYNNNQIHIYLDTIKLDKHFVYYLNDLLSVIIKDIKK